MRVQGKHFTHFSEDVDTAVNLLVGAPVHRREWVIEAWMDHIEVACERVGVEPSYLLAIDPRDEPTVSLVQNRAHLYFRDLAFVYCEEDRLTAERCWNIDRYRRMVYLRNMLLQGVRQLEPDFFLSIDSDILLHPDALRNMLQTQFQREWGGVGGKTYLTSRGRSFPNYANLTRAGSLQRTDHSGVMACDVIMALKLMTPEAYAVDYEEHDHGEDIGYSLACKRAGVKLGWDGRVASKHCMAPSDLERLDERCGY